MAHVCEAMIVTCMDFRIQKYVEEWARTNLGERNYDRISTAGAVFDPDFVMKMVELSVRLHQTKKMVLVNHEDCGAYGAAGTVAKHAADLKAMAQKIKSAYPNLEIELYYLHLDGAFDRVN